MGLEALRRHHADRAEQVSREMLPPDALAALFEPWFEVHTAEADAEKYPVSGCRRPDAPSPDIGPGLV